MCFIICRQEEENPSDDLLGAATAEAKKQAKALSAELGGAAPETDGGSPVCCMNAVPVHRREYTVYIESILDRSVLDRIYVAVVCAVEWRV